MMTLFPKIVIAALCALTAGCNTPLAERAKRSDGLLGLVFNSPGPDTVPVERVSQGAGEIVTAHAVAPGHSLVVSGIAGRVLLHEPRYGSHVDVFVLDASGKTTQAVATPYLPRTLPNDSSRSGRARAQYAVILPGVPAAGSTVRVAFHGVSPKDCPLSGH